MGTKLDQKRHDCSNFLAKKDEQAKEISLNKVWEW